MSFDPGVFDPQVFGASTAESCLFDGAVFDSAVFDVCEDGGEPPALSPATTAPAAAGIARKRRRYIMPDGTMLEATTQEAYEWLRLYSTPAAPAPKAAPQRTIHTPQVVLEKRDVRFIPATDSAPDTWKAIVSERFTFKPPPDVTRQAQERLNRIRAANNAALVALLM